MLQRFILNDKNVQKQAVLWNMIATIASSFQTMILMLILTHKSDFISASIITIGYAIANLAMTIGKYGIRNYQVSDVREKYGFETYLRTRYITVAIMSVFSIIYFMKGMLCDGYSMEKGLSVLLICMYKSIESFEDVYHGRMQQMNRLDIGMRILAIRNIIYIVEFVVVYCMTNNLLFTLLVSVVTTLLLAFALNRIPEKNIYYVNNEESRGTIKELLIECLPVAVAAFLLMYLGNAPKYIMDAIVSDEEQTYFNILFMVTFAVNLLGVFIFNPLVRKMAVLWNDKKISEFQGHVVKILLCIAGVVIVGIIFATVIGRKMLGWIYGVSLEGYKAELLLMLVAGGELAVLNLMNLLLVLIRRQNVLMFLCALTSLVLLMFGERFLLCSGIFGLVIFYAVALGILNITLLIVLKWNLLHAKKS